MQNTINCPTWCTVSEHDEVELPAHNIALHVLPVECAAPAVTVEVSCAENVNTGAHEEAFVFLNAQGLTLRAAEARMAAAALLNAADRLEEVQRSA